MLYQLSYSSIRKSPAVIIITQINIYYNVLNLIAAHRIARLPQEYHNWITYMMQQLIHVATILDGTFHIHVYMNSM